MRPSRNGVRGLLANPGWLPVYLRKSREARAMRRKRARSSSDTFRLSDHEDLVHSEREAVLMVTDASSSAYDAALAEAWLPEPVPEDGTAWSSRLLLLRVLAVVVELGRPRTAVEIGVERGYSTSVLLHGMHGSTGASVFSVDLPPIGAASRAFTGSIIPDRLRERWDLTLGPSQRELPGVLKRSGPIDLFIHDGDHSYRSQREDLECAWPTLRGGGIAIVDDVWSRSLIDFGASVGEEPVLIPRWDDHDAVGMIRKSKG